MKVFINCKEWEFQEGTKVIEVVNLIGDPKKDGSTIKTSTKQTDGKRTILFVLNGRFVHPREYEILEIKEGDHIRWVHPYAGG